MQAERRGEAVCSCAGHFMPSASCGLSALNSCTKASKRSCCCKLFEPGGRVVSFLRVRCMQLGEIEQAIGTGEGNAVVGADRERQASLTGQAFESPTREGFARRPPRLAP